MNLMSFFPSDGLEIDVDKTRGDRKESESEDEEREEGSILHSWLVSPAGTWKGGKESEGERKRKGKGRASLLLFLL